MRVTVRKWGNSAAVRLPAAVMQAAHVKLGASVEVREEGGRIVIEPLVEAEEVSLDDLLAGITDDNVHEAIDFGPPVGAEML